MTTFSFDGRVSVTVRVMDRTYVLESDSSISGSSRLRVRFHKPFDDAFVVGKMADLLTEIDTNNTLQLKNKLDVTAWNSLKTQALALPGLGPIFQAVLDTDLRITDIELDLEAPAGVGPTPAGVGPTIGRGKVELGIAFDCRPAAPNNKVLGIALETVGILIRFDYGT